MDIDDCIIVGAGPAGLTAAIYLARYHLSIRMFDCGTSRAGWIPRTRNHAGFPDGISGEELLQRMRDQAARYGALREPRRVSDLKRDGDHFTVDEHAWSEFIERKERLRHDGRFETHAHYAVQQTMTDDAHVYASSNLELFLHLVHALV